MSIGSQDQRSGRGIIEQKCDGIGFKHYFGSRMNGVNWWPLDVISKPKGY